MPAPTPRSHPVRSRGRLEALIADLGPGLRRGDALPAAPEHGRLLASGLTDIDGLIGGGFPADRLSEITGPPSSGRTSVGLALLARITGQGELAAFVDRADAFDPASAAAAGVDLDRVLWARAGAWREALLAVERLLETEGIPLVMLDLGSGSSAGSRSRAPAMVGSRSSAAVGSRSPAAAGSRSSATMGSRASATVGSRASAAVGSRVERARRRRSASRRGREADVLERIPASAWIRLARLATGTESALVVLSDRRLTGSQADLVLEMQSERPRFTGTPPLLEAVGRRALLVRRRGAPALEASREHEASPGPLHPDTPEKPMRVEGSKG